MPYQRVRRIFRFLEAMESSPACSTRDQAFDLFYSTWLNVNADLAVPDKDIERFRQMQLRQEDGWLDLNADPCYLPSVEHTGLCVYLHNDGRIVIQDFSNPSRPILLAKLGARLIAT